MQRSEDRILTTHVGSLPLPPALRDLLVRQDRNSLCSDANEETASRRAGANRGRSAP